MAIDLDALRAREPDTIHTRLHFYLFGDLGGIEACWMRFQRGDYDEAFLVTELDLLEDAEERARERDRSKEAKERAIRLRHTELRAAHAARWATQSLAETVYEIWDRVWNQREWMGQSQGRVIYAQEVARLLEIPHPDSFSWGNPIWEAIQTLRDGERMDLNGAILWPYEPRFRLPEELQGLLHYLVEEPLGWPNGDAGDFALSTLEGAIGEHTDFKHGRDLVGEENFPRLAARHRMSYGFRWLASAIDEVEREGLGVVDHDPERLAERLEDLAKQLRTIAWRSRRS